MMVTGRHAQNVQVNRLDGIFGTHRVRLSSQGL